MFKYTKQAPQRLGWVKVNFLGEKVRFNSVTGNTEQLQTKGARSDVVRQQQLGWHLAELTSFIKDLSADDTLQRTWTWTPAANFAC